MKRLLLIMATVLAVVLSAMPVVAGTQIEASGDWDYVPVMLPPTKVAGSNAFIASTDVGTWTGTLEGESVESYVLVAHKKHGTYQGLMEFTGEVEGKFGTLIIKTNGSGPMPVPEDWTGRWVILSGTGDLENLHGQGTWAGDLPNLLYEGKVHFSG
jgi:hypothetical protein